MTRRVVANYPGLGAHVAAIAPCVFNPDSDHVIGSVEQRSDQNTDHTVLLGGIIFTMFTESSCFVHIGASHERWLSRDLLWAAGHYPFVQLKLTRMYAVIEAANQHAMQFSLRIGWELHGELPDMFASGPGVIVTMHRDSCRWLRHTPSTIRAGDGSRRE